LDNALIVSAMLCCSLLVIAEPIEPKADPDNVLRVKAYLDCVTDSQLPQGLLFPNERLARGHDIVSTWTDTRDIYWDIDSNKDWDRFYDFPNYYLPISQVYSSFLLSAANTWTDDQTNCLLSARDSLTNFGWYKKNNTAPLYYEDLDVYHWQHNFAVGAYQQPFGCARSWRDTKGVLHTVKMKAFGLIRVNVQPREWYLPSVPFGLRNSPLRQSTVCDSRFQSVQQCFFDSGGYFTAITTGFLVAVNVSVIESSPNLNSTITSPRSQPAIIAWIIARMPQWAPLCPCSDTDPIRRSAFCTAPWNETSV